MNPMKSTTRALAVALSLFAWSFALSQSAAAQPGARQRLDKSAGWGVDRASGAVVVEASLLVLYDPMTRTLVLNPNFVADAIAETGAVVLRDGSWRMPDGNVIRPLLGTASIVLGDEPAGLLEASGLPAVPYDRVNLVDRVGVAALDSAASRTSGGSVLVKAPLQTTGFALKVKHSNTCAGCYEGCGIRGCPNGGREEFVALTGYHGVCEFKLFHRCKQEWKPACRVDIHECSPCLGPVLDSWQSWDWHCSGGC